MKEDAVIISESRAVCGGPENSGHPKIYLKTDKNHQATCPYCGQKFIYKPEQK